MTYLINFQTREQWFQNWNISVADLVYEKLLILLNQFWEYSIVYRFVLEWFPSAFTLWLLKSLKTWVFSTCKHYSFGAFGPYYLFQRRVRSWAPPFKRYHASEVVGAELLLAVRTRKTDFWNVSLLFGIASNWRDTLEGEKLFLVKCCYLNLECLNCK